MKELFNKLYKLGWRIELGRKHIKATPPRPLRGMVVISSTASDRRALLNIRGDVRRLYRLENNIESPI